MLAHDRHSPTDALRAQDEEGDLQDREATASLVDVVCPQRLLYLPPSPPYSNPRLKFPITLPSLGDYECRSCTSYVSSTCDMGTPPDTVQYVVKSGGTDWSLLSPPYSPRRTLLRLSDVDEEEEYLLSPEAPSERSVTSDDQGWQTSDEWDDALGSPSLRFKDLDLREESDWDEPSFLKATRPKDPTDGLDLNLFGAVPSSSPTSRVCPPSSPRARNFVLPVVENLEKGETDEPLFKPSDFDVFENSWDEIGQDAPSPVLDESFQYDISRELAHASPGSPSRRGSIGLPDVCAALEATGLMYPSTSTGNPQGSNGNHLFLDRSSFERSLQTPPRHLPTDIPSEVFQSPYQIPLIFSSPPPRSPPLHSLLFAPPEAQDVPLPGSPESRLQDLFNGDFVVHSYLLEESRLRAMQQEMTSIEAQARSKETMLTEYITRLNAMKPSVFASSSASYLDDGAPGSTTEGAENSAGECGAGPESGSSSSPPSQACASAAMIPIMTIADFQLFRRCEVQNAVAMRATERRRRKQAKERARELEALLQLKEAQIHDLGRWIRASRRKRGGADETIVLAASGSDRHPDHTNAMICDDSSGQGSDERPDEVRQLVAKMIFRRRDSSRPLSGKLSQPTRPYVFSTLSQELMPHVDDDDEVLRAELEQSS